MRIRDLTLALLLSACVHDTTPDPRQLDAETMARSGLGAWVVAHTETATFVGELIAVTHSTIWLLRQNHLGVVDIGDINTATVWLYDVDTSALETWRVFGGLSTLTHGVALVLTLPLWLGVSAGVVNRVIDASKLEYPEVQWEELAKWARFPQGVPPGVDEQALVHQQREAKHAPEPVREPADAGAPDAEPYDTMPP